MASSSDSQLTRSFQVLCDICSETTHEAVKSCLNCVVSYCEAHLEPHTRVPSFRSHKLIDPVENLKIYICQKHKQPLELFCRDEHMSICLFCTEGDHRDHNSVDLAAESREKKAKLRELQARSEQMTQDYQQKIRHTDKFLKHNRTNTNKEKAESTEMLRSLLWSIERNQIELFRMIDEKLKTAESQAEDFKEDLRSEINRLNERNLELEQIINTEDHIHLLENYPSLHNPPNTRDLNQDFLDSNPDVGTMRTALFQLKDSIYNGMKNLVDLELKKIQQYAVNVILDPDTAHPNLILSDDGKQVRCGDQRQNLPDNPRRFNSTNCVLGKEGFSSGRFYFEVQVSGKSMWQVGVARGTANREWEVMVSPDDGYWCVWLKMNTEYEVSDSPCLTLYLRQAPQKVGVFVDYEEGLVSFYDVEIKSHIYSFTGQSFTGKLHPLFNPGRYNAGENKAPLVICPVEN